MAKWLERGFYPPHLVVSNWVHTWRGKETAGRAILCQACDIMSNTRTRNGDARFIRTHRRCMRYVS